MGVSASIGGLALGLFLAGAALAAEPVGTVKIVRGAAEVLRAASVLPAEVNQRLFEGDRLRTGANGAIGVVLADDTRLSLGPESELLLDRFLFAPAAGRLGMALRLVRGMASYISGKIEQLAPEAVRFETPVGTVGIRGTRFVARVEDR